MATIKGVVIGDTGCGKTTLFRSYVALSKGKDLSGLETDDKTEVPESTNNYAVAKIFGDEMYFLSLFNTAGQEDNDDAMKLFYQNSAVFIVCFSTLDKSSLESVKLKWVPAIKDACPSAPFVLAGTKIDQRDDSENCVSKADGAAAAQELGAVQYIECSANTQEGVETLFDEGIEAGKARAAQSETGGEVALNLASVGAATVPVPTPPRARKAEMIAKDTPAKDADAEKKTEMPPAEPEPKQDKSESGAELEIEKVPEEPKKDSDASEEKPKEESKKEKGKKSKEKGEKSKRNCTIL